MSSLLLITGVHNNKYYEARSDPILFIQSVAEGHAVSI